MNGTNSFVPRRIVILAVLAPIVLLLLVQFIRPPAAGLWTNTFYNSLHVPVFAIIGMCLFILTGARGEQPAGRRAAIAFGIAALLGVLSEAAQIVGPRHASLEDLLFDWLGAAGAILLATAFAAQDQWQRGSRIVTGVSGVLLLLLALQPLFAISAAYVERNRSLPDVIAFDAWLGRRFYLPQNARIEIVDDPAGRPVGELTLGTGPWPGLILHDIWPDWRTYATLAVELELLDGPPFDVNIRVHDRQHSAGKQPYGDRFNTTVTLAPGRHTVRLPLEDIRDAPAGRRMNMAQIDGVVLFCGRGLAGRSFRVVSIRLE